MTTRPAAAEVWFLTGSQGLYGEDVLEPGRRPVRGDRRDGSTRPTTSRRRRRGSRCSPTPTRSARDARRPTPTTRASASSRGCTRSARRRCGSPASTRCASRCCTCTPRPTSSCRGPTIDMDFMNLNQAAHGDREFGYIQTRLGVARKTVAGHVERPGGHRPGRRLGARRASGAPSCARMRLARFGDNMRDVAVTEGDKVEAELRFGVSVNTYGVNDLVAVVDAVDRRATIDDAGRRSTPTSTTSRPSCCPAATGTSRCATAPASSSACGRSSTDGGFTRVHHQLRGPRRAAAAARPRRAAADGRRLRLRRRGRLEDLGHAAHAQGRWPHGPARRHVLHGGLHLPPGPRRGEDPRRAHARGLPVASPPARPSLEIHPLGIGGREDPVRLVFDADPGPARSSSASSDMRRPVPARRQRGRGRRARTRRCRSCRSPAPSGSPAPDLAHLDRGWLTAGGPHHTVLSTALTAEVLGDFAEMAGTELVAHRRRHHDPPLPPGAALEPGLLPTRPGVLRSSPQAHKEAISET